jgi:hypothetical protein
MTLEVTSSFHPADAELGMLSSPFGLILYLGEAGGNFSLSSSGIFLDLGWFSKENCGLAYILDAYPVPIKIDPSEMLIYSYLKLSLTADMTHSPSLPDIYLYNTYIYA